MADADLPLIVDLTTPGASKPGHDSDRSDRDSAAPRPPSLSAAHGAHPCLCLYLCWLYLCWLCLCL